MVISSILQRRTSIPMLIQKSFVFDVPIIFLAIVFYLPSGNRLSSREAGYTATYRVRSKPKKKSIQHE